MKNVLITGGNGDIARAIIDELESTKQYLIYAPDRFELDVTNREKVIDYFEKNEIDIVINNAGFIEPIELSKTTFDNYYKTFNINVLSIFHINQTAYNKNHNVLIVNIGSSAATKSHANWSAYCASKAALVMANECWFLEGIKTICVSPGRTATKMRSALFPNESPETLLKPADFAKVIRKTLNYDYPLGINLDVNINNIGDLLK